MGKKNASVLFQSRAPLDLGERGMSSKQLGIGAALKGKSILRQVRTGVSSINAGGNAWGHLADSEYSPRIMVGNT